MTHVWHSGWNPVEGGLERACRQSRAYFGIGIGELAGMRNDQLTDWTGLTSKQQFVCVYSEISNEQSKSDAFTSFLSPSIFFFDLQTLNGILKAFYIYFRNCYEFSVHQLSNCFEHL